MLRYRPRRLHLQTYVMLRYRPRRLHLQNFKERIDLAKSVCIRVGSTKLGKTSKKMFLTALQLAKTEHRTHCCGSTPHNGNGAGKTVPVPIWAVWQPRLFERTCSERAAPEKKAKSPNFLLFSCGETQIHQKTRHSETASFYSWRSQKHANTSEKWWKNKTQWNLPHLVTKKDDDCFTSPANTMI